MAQQKKRRIALVGALVVAMAAGIAYPLFGADLIDRVLSNAGQPASASAPTPVTSPLLEARKKAEEGRKRIEAEARVPAAPSPWIVAEKDRYTEALSAVKPKIAVLPFLIPGDNRQNGIDLSARMVMAYLVAERIAASTGESVADIEFVSRALGEPRELGRNDAIGFAKKIGASKLILGEASHNGSGQLQIAVSLFNVPQSSAAAIEEPKTWSKVGLETTPALPPELVFARFVDESVSQLLPENRIIGGTGKEGATSSGLAKSPLAAIDGARTVADGIWTQLLLGILTPNETPRARERIFERALAGVESLPRESRDYRVLKARALAHLGRRPAALAVLDTTAKSPEEQALLAMLNGNVPEITRSIGHIKNPLPLLVSRIEKVWVEARYGLENEDLIRTAGEILKTVPKDWAAPVEWFIASHNLWNVGPTLPVKVVMDAHFPVAGFSAEEIVRSKVAAGRRDSQAGLEIEAMPVAHATKAFAQSGATWCCDTRAWKPQHYQYLNLLAAGAEGMLIRVVDHYSYIQGQREQALQLAAQIDEAAFMGGSIPLNLRRAQMIATAMQQNPASPQYAMQGETLYQTAKRVRYWNTSDPVVAADAAAYESMGANTHFSELAPVPRGPVGYPRINDFVRDLPPSLGAVQRSERYQAASYEVESDPAVFEIACELSISWPDPCNLWRLGVAASGKSDASQTIETAHLIERFNGSPKRAEFIIAAYTSRGDVERATKFAAEQIKLRPRDWSSYRTLGNIYSHAGQFKEAANAYLAFPIFRNPPADNTVGISVNAEISANDLARRGAIAEAKPLYEIAARYRNGSAASLQAQSFLASFDRRFGDAETATREKLERYRDGGSMRAYFALLFALGDSKNAWAGLRDGIARVDDMAPWRAVPVGLRLEGADVNAAKQWLQEYGRPGAAPDQSRGNPVNLRALSAIVQTLATDRDQQSIGALAAMTNEVLPARPSGDAFFAANLDNVPPENRDGVRKAIEAAKARFEASRKSAPAESPTWANSVKRFVKGYDAIKRADYQSAWDTFQENRFPSNYRDAFEASVAGLPYHALAAVKLGKSDEFSKFLDETSKEIRPTAERNFNSPAYPEFERHLARAVLAMSKGEFDASRQQLLLARGKFPDVGQATRPLVPEYIFAEICEILSIESKRSEYLELAVAWAKSWQVYDPSSAWPHAFEAKYGKDSTARVRAYAIASYLNRHSARIADVSPDIAARGKAWLESNKPFPRSSAADKPGIKS
jgi:hypothetical protein